MGISTKARVETVYTKQTEKKEKLLNELICGSGKFRWVH